MTTMKLTDRQQRELEYHKGHAALARVTPMKFDVLYSPKRRWWNAFWDTWTYLKSIDLRRKRVLVIGCGGGEDAILFAKLGARVSAFDLSPDMLAIARAKAALSNVEAIDFQEMPSESLSYQDATFDVIYARDILHHVEIPETMREIRRASKPGSLFILNEIYSHSVTDRIRHANWVEKRIYPHVKKIIYGNKKPYITDDERKMTERDICLVKDHLAGISREKYFNFLVTRIICDTNVSFSKIDRILLAVGGKPIGRLIAGRIVLVGTLPV